MEVLSKHMVKEDPQQSTDWTTIGARILKAATIASAVHVEEWMHISGISQGMCERWNRENSNGNG